MSKRKHLPRGRTGHVTFGGDLRPLGRARRISLDASHADGWACVVAILEARDARVLFMDAIRCATSSQAEQAALEKAMGLAAKIGWTQCEFRTDSRDVHWPKGVDRPEGWALQRIDRSQNVAAHVVAKEGLKLWQAGRRGVPTEELAASASSVIT